jgi:hypothetical protein
MELASLLAAQSPLRIVGVRITPQGPDADHGIDQRLRPLSVLRGAVDARSQSLPADASGSADLGASRPRRVGHAPLLLRLGGSSAGDLRRAAAGHCRAARPQDLPAGPLSTGDGLQHRRRGRVAWLALGHVREPTAQDQAILQAICRQWPQLQETAVRRGPPPGLGSRRGSGPSAVEPGAGGRAGQPAETDQAADVRPGQLRPAPSACAARSAGVRQRQVDKMYAGPWALDRRDPTADRPT